MRALLLIAVSALVLAVGRTEDGGPPAFDEHYMVGMRAYTEERWEVCTKKMQQAVRDYEKYKLGSVKCLKQCHSKQVPFQVLHMHVLLSLYITRIVEIARS